MFTTVLPKNQTQCLALLGREKILPKNSYLAGGTALALWYGHRESVDLDFFTPDSFDQGVLSDKLSEIANFSSRRTDKDTLIGEINGVAFSIFRYSYPLIFSLTDYEGINMLDPREIGAMKIGAVMNRGTKKDFVDLYELSYYQNISLDSCLEIYKEKYGNFESGVYSFLLGLSYFVETERTEMPKMFRKVNWNKIKKYFSGETIRLKKKYM